MRTRCGRLYVGQPTAASAGGLLHRGPLPAPLHPPRRRETQRGHAGPPGSRLLTRRLRGALRAALSRPTRARHAHDGPPPLWRGNGWGHPLQAAVGERAGPGKRGKEGRQGPPESRAEPAIQVRHRHRMATRPPPGAPARQSGGAPGCLAPCSSQSECRHPGTARLPGQGAWKTHRPRSGQGGQAPRRCSCVAALHVGEADAVRTGGVGLLRGGANGGTPSAPDRPGAIKSGIEPLPLDLWGWYGGLTYQVIC
jgi:hypothetical protein